MSSAWYDRQVDVDHIRGRGFEVLIASGRLRVDDPDEGGPLPRLLGRSVWGPAVPNAVGRLEFPDDFEPDAFTGSQLCAAGFVRIPPGIRGRLPQTERAVARGAWTYDLRLEVVVEVDLNNGDTTAWPIVGQLLFEEIAGVDPFVVAASRVLEPLIAELRFAVATTALEGSTEVVELRGEIERLAELVRSVQTRPARKQILIAASLSANATLTLNILSNRIDGLLDRVDWPTVWDAIRVAGQHLGL
jgi:hypothetical protein